MRQQLHRDGQEKIGDVVGTLHFYNPPADGSDPFFEVTDPSGTGRKNYGHNPMPVLIRDMRGRERQFSLMQHSFAAISEDRPEIIDLENVEDVKERYSLSAVNSILKHVPASEKVVVFDSTIRRASPEKVSCRPVRKVHIDQTPLGVLQRMKKHLSDHEAAEVQAGRLRFRLINVWRPLLGPVLDHPLAMAESLSIKDMDLVEVKHVYPDSTGETYAVKYNSTQKFWYWSNMSTEEALLLQCFDNLKQVDDLGSLQDNRCAHASFTLFQSGEERDCRESIEIRCLVLG